MNFIPYYRVSTQRQSDSGLGLEAQRDIVHHFIQARQGSVIAELSPETASGRDSNRPVLNQAISLARQHNAVIVVAKLDRLSRDVHFTSGLAKSGVKFVICDNPNINELTLNILASVAQEERRLISERTRSALAARKRRGLPLGNPANLHGHAKGSAATKKRFAHTAAHNLLMVLGLQSQGLATDRQIADEMNRRQIPTPLNKHWHPNTIHRLRKLVKNKDLAIAS